MAEIDLRVNGEREPFVPSLAELLARRAIPLDRPGVAVAIGEEVVPRREWPTRALRPGDEIEIVGAVQGG